MDIDIERWRSELKMQRKHLVHWGLKEGEWVFAQCFKRILDPNRKCIPVLFRTNPNLYKPRNLNKEKLC